MASTTPVATGVVPCNVWQLFPKVGFAAISEFPTASMGPSCPSIEFS